MKISWMPRAVMSFFKISDYLEEKHGKKKADEFVAQVKKTIKRIEKQPYMYKTAKKNKTIRKGFVNKFVSMFYKVKEKEEKIELIEFWDNRQDPTKLKH